MAFDETVDIIQAEGAPDDAAQTEGQGKVPGATPLSEYFGGEEAAQGEQAPAEGEPDKKTGYMAKVRESAREQGYQKAQAEFAAWKAQFIADQEQTIAPLRELALAHEADKLVASGEIKTREMALKYLKAVGGVSGVTPEGPARDAQGRFQAQQAAGDDGVKARAEALHRQSQAIQKLGGPNMTELYMTDSAVREAVDNGMDFNTAYGLIQARGGASSRPKAPGAVRSPNNPAYVERDIASMSKEEFARLDKAIDSGKKIML